MVSGSSTRGRRPPIALRDLANCVHKDKPRPRSTCSMANFIKHDRWAPASRGFRDIRSRDLRGFRGNRSRGWSDKRGAHEQGRANAGIPSDWSRKLRWVVWLRPGPPSYAAGIPAILGGAASPRGFRSFWAEPRRTGIPGAKRGAVQLSRGGARRAGRP